MSDPRTMDSETRIEERLQELERLVRGIARKFTRPQDLDDAAQEASLALWRLLREKPDASDALLKTVIRCRIIKAIQRGCSVDTRTPRRAFRWTILSLEGLQVGERGGGPFAAEDQLWHSRRGKPLSPVEDVALTRVALHQLRMRLTERQREFLELRLQEYSLPEISQLMGITPKAAYKFLCRIRQKAMEVLDEDGLGYRRRGPRPKRGNQPGAALVIGAEE